MLENSNNQTNRILQAAEILDTEDLQPYRALPIFQRIRKKLKVPAEPQGNASSCAVEAIADGSIRTRPENNTSFATDAVSQEGYTSFALSLRSVSPTNRELLTSVRCEGQLSAASTNNTSFPPTRDKDQLSVAPDGNISSPSTRKETQSLITSPDDTPPKITGKDVGSVEQDLVEVPTKIVEALEKKWKNLSKFLAKNAADAITGERLPGAEDPRILDIVCADGEKRQTFQTQLRKVLAQRSLAKGFREWKIQCPKGSVRKYRAHSSDTTHHTTFYRAISDGQKLLDIETLLKTRDITFSTGLIALLAFSSTLSRKLKRDDHISFLNCVKKSKIISGVTKISDWFHKCEKCYESFLSKPSSSKKRTASDKSTLLSNKRPCGHPSGHLPPSDASVAVCSHQRTMSPSAPTNVHHVAVRSAERSTSASITDPQEDGDISLNEFFYQSIHQGDPESREVDGQIYSPDISADSTRTISPNNYPTQGLYREQIYTPNVTADSMGTIPLRNYFTQYLHQNSAVSGGVSEQIYSPDVTTDSTRTIPPNNYLTQGLHQNATESYGGSEQIYTPDVTADSIGTIPLRNYFTQCLHQNSAASGGVSGQIYSPNITTDSTRTISPMYLTQGLYQNDAGSYGINEYNYASSVTVHN